ncbi:MAG: pyridoxal phosphate-dependent aminotransferase [Acidimicrobiia bacterium]|nr:pyridoxal phosphate-dependent aminotransferase [Acidimicrobiia bacterium]MYB72556.1 pyridoxal phosphate-dependent aminotransferase [Acidimicrobiia bacterium]MYH98029.1 pyridoxal phosphate-dependent aminotransferase [Acidimicrobiia bacterium]
MVPERLLNERLVEFGTTIFAEMSALALATGAINLGQGFPDTDGPQEVADAAVAAIRAGHNQYPPGLGIADLRLAVAEHQNRFYDLDFDPDTEVLITAGATEAIAAVMLSLLEPGDEVVLFEPYYDSHIAGIAMSGAQRRLVTLRPPDYRFDPDELAAAIGPRTRMIVVNSPHNPTGKVFDRGELDLIAELCRRHDLLAVTDEVYEHLAYDGEHIPMATLPGMRERTITVSSGGKTFSFTGWKIGWVCAVPELRDAVTTTKQFLTFVNGAPFQHAIAVGLRLGDDYFDGLRAGLMARRDQLSGGLAAAGFEVFRPAGTYFVTADVRPLGFDDGMALCRKLPELCGVVAVPSVVFYDNEDEGRHLVRFAFCKRPEVLDEAVERLAKLGAGS